MKYLKRKHFLTRIFVIEYFESCNFDHGWQITRKNNAAFGGIKSVNNCGVAI